MKKISISNLVSYILFALSALILSACIYFAMNIKVLSEWQLVLPEGTADIHVGDMVIVQSIYNKLQNVSGESTRYIECKNRVNVWVRYELNRATSDRAAGKNATGIPLTIRRDIADVPTTCKFSITIAYNVLPFRQVYVSNSTKEFNLLGERTTSVSSEDESPSTTQESPSQPLADMPGESSSSNSTPQEQSMQLEPSQPPESPTPSPAPEPPSRTDQLIDFITNLPRRIL